MAETLKVKLETVDRGLGDYWYAVGCIRLAQGHIDEAVGLLKQAAADNHSFYSRHMLGRILLQAGQADEAAAAFEAALRDYVDLRFAFIIWSTKAHYYLGLAYEQTNKLQQAAEQYEIFLTIWAEASPTPPEIADARTRLTRIRSRI